ncbi:LysM peptidoglycan-binding domain-containing protein [Arthrobacter sp. StoSoilB5]|jgi:LysM repeat protein|uniref:LysM peptidoglycan-binding domain-containing protein n=1 Tax=Arthrobacter sp. StoSoilB5 TaxID=2830992 RepID=UPI001CC44B76|nr:LysM peptidoglycan-binding domain-containing protein [Arthrobacter sp. StoSoilB5]BCW46498.1 hypothetical protein StoSoilB5_36820 [Arthrobacter sp. StoSoilB5]
MGLLDNLKKNLGLGEKDHRGQVAPTAPEAAADQSAADQAAEDAAAVGTSSKAAAEAAAAQAAEQQEAANAAGAQIAGEAGLEPEAPEVQPLAQQAAAEAAAGTGQPGPVAPRVTEVVVEPGDTMRGIAAQFGVDLGALIATNADTVPNPDLIYPGQVLRLP